MDNPCKDDEQKSWWDGSNPVTYEDLLQRTHQWSLGADAATATILQQISSKLISTTEVVTGALTKVSNEVEDFEASLRNITNKLDILSNNQFVESRIQEDESTDNPRDEVHEEGELPLRNSVSQCKEAVELGLNCLRDSYVKFNISDSESDSEKEQLIVYKRKNHYSNRNLPHIICSEKFYSDPTLGLEVSKNIEEEKSFPTLSDEDEDVVSSNQTQEICFQKTASFYDSSDTEDQSKENKNEENTPGSNSQKPIGGVNNIFPPVITNSIANHQISPARNEGDLLSNPAITSPEKAITFPQEIIDQMSSSLIKSKDDHLTKKSSKKSSLFESSSDENDDLFGSSKPSGHLSSAPSLSSRLSQSSPKLFLPSTKVLPSNSEDLPQKLRGNIDKSEDLPPKLSGNLGLPPKLRGNVDKSDDLPPKLPGNLGKSDDLPPKLSGNVGKSSLGIGTKKAMKLFDSSSSEDDIFESPSSVFPSDAKPLQFTDSLTKSDFSSGSRFDTPPSRFSGDTCDSDHLKVPSLRQQSGFSTADPNASVGISQKYHDFNDNQSNDFGKKSADFEEKSPDFVKKSDEFKKKSAFSKPRKLFSSSSDEDEDSIFKTPPRTRKKSDRHRSSLFSSEEDSPLFSDEKRHENNEIPVGKGGKTNSPTVASVPDKIWTGEEEFGHVKPLESMSHHSPTLVKDQDDYPGGSRDIKKLTLKSDTQPSGPSHTESGLSHNESGLSHNESGSSHTEPDTEQAGKEESGIKSSNPIGNVFNNPFQSNDLKGSGTSRHSLFPQKNSISSSLFDDDSEDELFKDSSTTSEGSGMFAKDNAIEQGHGVTVDTTQGGHQSIVNTAHAGHQVSSETQDSKIIQKGPKDSKVLNSSLENSSKSSFSQFKRVLEQNLASSILPSHSSRKPVGGVRLFGRELSKKLEGRAQATAVDNEDATAVEDGGEELSNKLEGRAQATAGDNEDAIAVEDGGEIQDVDAMDKTSKVVQDNEYSIVKEFSESSHDLQRSPEIQQVEETNEHRSQNLLHSALNSTKTSIDDPRKSSLQNDFVQENLDDHPVAPKVLESLTKGRPKIQRSRRLPSRNGGRIVLRSSIEEETKTCPIETETCPVEAQSFPAENSPKENENISEKSDKNLTLPSSAVEGLSEKCPRGKDSEHGTAKASQKELRTEHETLKASQKELRAEHEILKASQKELRAEHETLKASQKVLRVGSKVSEPKTKTLANIFDDSDSEDDLFHQGTLSSTINASRQVIIPNLSNEKSSSNIIIESEKKHVFDDRQHRGFEVKKSLFDEDSQDELIHSIDHSNVIDESEKSDSHSKSDFVIPRGKRTDSDESPSDGTFSIDSPLGLVAHNPVSKGSEPVTAGTNVGSGKSVLGSKSGNYQATLGSKSGSDSNPNPAYTKQASDSRPITSPHAVPDTKSVNLRTNTSKAGSSSHAVPGTKPVTIKTGSSLFGEEDDGPLFQPPPLTTLGKMTSIFGDDSDDDLFG